jgi:hypothetical protein
MCRVNISIAAPKVNKTLMRMSWRVPHEFRAGSYLDAKTFAVNESRKALEVRRIRQCFCGVERLPSRSISGLWTLYGEHILAGRDFQLIKKCRWLSLSSGEFRLTCCRKSGKRANFGSPDMLPFSGGREMRREKLLNRHLIEVRKRPTVRSALMQLQEAYELARSENLPIEEFAIRLSSLIQGGGSAAAAQWLVNSRYARLTAEDGTVDSSGSFVRNRPRNGPLSNHSRLTLTERGLELARGCNGTTDVELSVTSTSLSTMKPHWHRKKRELWVGNQLIKRFTKTAKNQHLIMEVFEEEGWPPSIDDPFPGGTHQEKRKRLNNAVDRLNHGHLLPLLRFHTNGTGDGIRWEFCQRNGQPKS